MVEYVEKGFYHVGLISSIQLYNMTNESNNGVAKCHFTDADGYECKNHAQSTCWVLRMVFFKRISQEIHRS